MMILYFVLAYIISFDLAITTWHLRCVEGQEYCLILGAASMMIHHHPCLQSWCPSYTHTPTVVSWLLLSLNHKIRLIKIIGWSKLYEYSERWSCVACVGLLCIAIRICQLWVLLPCKIYISPCCLYNITFLSYLLIL